MKDVSIAPAPSVTRGTSCRSSARRAATWEPATPSQYGKAGFKLSVFGYEPTAGLRGHRPRPLRAAGQFPRARTEPAVEKADAAGPARRRPADEDRLDRIRDAGRLDRLGSSGSEPVRSASHPNRGDAAAQDHDPQAPAATARRRVLQRRHAAATSPRWPSSTRWTKASCASRRDGLVTTNGKGQAAGARAVRRTGGYVPVRRPVLRSTSSWPAGRTRTSSTNWPRPSSANWGSSRPVCAATRPSCDGPISTRSATMPDDRADARAFSSSKDPAKRRTPGRPPAGPHRRSAARRAQRRLRRLVDAQMVRPDPQPEQRPGRAGNVGLPQLAERIVPLEQAVRPIRARSWSPRRVRSTASDRPTFSA